MRRLLLTNNHLANFGGSEMVTLELAEEFVARGWKVDVFTNFASAPFVHEFADLQSSGNLELFDSDPSRPLHEYDLLWVHHGVLPESILSALGSEQRVPIVWHHMSPFPGIESPVLAEVETAAASIISCMSPKTAETLSEYGIAADRITILPNPAPRSFTDGIHDIQLSSRLERILIVSNHPPEELLSAASMLQGHGITVGRIGGGKPSRVTPESFSDVDAVITIGKSVQYALALGIPVYNYDHFGGEGWITDSNFEVECTFNFSGRSTERKVSAHVLVRELLEGYGEAREFAQNRAPHHRKLFSLPHHIDRLLEQIQIANISRLLPASHIRRWLTYSRLQRDNTRALQGAWQVSQGLEIELRRSQEEISRLKEELRKYASENKALRHSKSFRLGHFLLKPFSKGRH